MIKNTLLYVISNALNKGAFLLYFPILTLTLSLDSFGTYSLSWVLIQFMAPILSLNGSTSILREGINDTTISFNLLSRYIFFTILITSFFYIFSQLYFSETWISLTVLLSGVEALYLITLMYLRTLDKAVQYFNIVLFKTAIVFGIILHAYIEHHKIEVMLYNQAIYTSFLIFIILIFIILSNIKKFSKLEISYISFAIILIPHGISQWIMSSSDRIIIDFLLGSQDVGKYSLGYTIATILMLVNSGLAVLLPQVMIRDYENWIKKSKDVYVMKIYAIASSIIFFLLILLLFIDRKYFALLGYYEYDMLIVFLIGYFSMYILGYYYIYANYLFYHKLASTISLQTFYAALINIILTVFLVMIVGLTGAIIATLISYMYYLYSIRKSAIQIEPRVMDISIELNIILLYSSIFFLVLALITYSIW